MRFNTAHLFTIVFMSLLSLTATGAPSPKQQSKQPISPFPSPFRPLISVSGGGEMLSSTPTNQFFIEPNQYIYNDGVKQPTSGLLGVFGGIEFLPTPKMALQLGIGYYHPGSFKFSGRLSQGIDPESFDHLKYHYQIESQQLLVESKWLALFFHPNVFPYFSFGLGTAYNRAYQYTSNPDVKTSMPITPVFSNGTTNTSFSYSWGLGFDGFINNHWRGGFGYRYSDVGNANLGPATISSIPIDKTFTQSHLKAQSLLIQLTYII